MACPIPWGGHNYSLENYFKMKWHHLLLKSALILNEFAGFKGPKTQQSFWSFYVICWTAADNTLKSYDFKQNILKLGCGPMPNVMAALPHIGGAICSAPQSLADAHY